MVEPTDQESDELARFREEWRAELAKRKAEASINTKGKQPELVLDSGKPATRVYRPPIRKTDDSSGASAIKKLAHPAIQDGKLEAVASPVLNNALGVYRQAVQHEQKGELDAALGLYRQAFRLVPFYLIIVVD